MCDACDKELIEMGILDSDLPNLPYKLMHWFCMVDGCTCKTKVRDYGIAPLYYWPVRIHRGKDTWRGGWCDPFHGYICSRHFKEYEKAPAHFFKLHASNGHEMLDRIREIPKKKKYV